MRLLIATAPEDVAATLARQIVEERLVACANIVPAVRSIYRWQGAIEDDAEALILMKTTADMVGRLTERLVELHP
jgi:periplasmic divalent cation tolerance protein